MKTEVKPFEQAIKQAKDIFDVIKDCPVVYEKEAAFAMQILEANNYLAGMNVNSIANAIKNVALCGITLNPAMKLAYLVPRDGRACLDISYMGIIKIATDSGSVTKVSCQLVYENDFFEVEQGTTEKVTHKPKPFAPRGNVIGVYCIAYLTDGGVQIETMSMEDVGKIRARSKAFTSGKPCPWTTDTGEMIRKTCVKRASKYWPKTERLAKAVVTLDEHEGYNDIVNQNGDEIIIDCEPSDELEERINSAKTIDELKELWLGDCKSNSKYTSLINARKAEL